MTLPSTARRRRRRSRGVTLARAIDRGRTRAVCNVEAAVRARCSGWSCADVDVDVVVGVVGVVVDAAVTVTDCIVRHADTRWR